MSAIIFPVKLGLTTCYLVKDEGMVLIDAGVPRKINTFKNALKKIQIDPRLIKLIIITHGHFDHAGSALPIRELTGASLLIHEGDREYLEQSKMLWPKGVNTWGRISRAIFKKLLKRAVEFPGTKADIVMKENEFPLHSYGIKGKIIHTPGHTPGSISVLLESGELFAGCMAHNSPPFRLSPGLPIYAEDIVELIKSWKKIIPGGVRKIYPGHGKPFGVDVINKAIKQL